MSYEDTNCKQALLLAKANTDKNTEILALNATARLKYQSDLDLYNKYLDNVKQWTDKTGNYSKWQADKIRLTNDALPWNNCVPWSDTSAGKHDDYCVNDIGIGWYHGGQTGNGCSIGFGKGLCKRTDAKINADLETDGYIAEQPIPIQKPILLLDKELIKQGNITCCSNIINVNDSLLQNVDITQASTCNASSVPVPINTPNVQNIPIQEPAPIVQEPIVQEPIVQEPVNASKNIIVITVAIIIILLLLLLSSIFVINLQ
jgi:hypothetical protein